MLHEIRDVRILNTIARRIDELSQAPELLGKPLTGELRGFRSLRAVGQRYRIIYRVELNRVVVSVVALGLCREGSRDDIYALAQHLKRVGLLE